MLHPLLKHQLSELGLNEDTSLPSLNEWQHLLSQVSQSYAKKAETHHPRQETRLHSLDAISKRTKIDNPQQLATILEMGIKHLNLEIGIISRIKDKRYTILHVNDPHHAISPDTVLALEDTYCEITLETNELVTINQAGQSELQTHPCYQKFSLEAYIGIPLWIEGKLLGTLSFSSTAPKSSPFTTADEDFVRIMGHWVSTTLERTRTSEAVRRANTRLRSRLEELATLNKIAQTLTSTLNLRYMLAAVNQELVNSLQVDTCGIALLNPDKTALIIVSEYTALEDTRDSAIGGILPLAENPMSIEVINTGQSAIVPLAKIAASDQKTQQILQKHNIQCLMIVPLLVRGQAIGTIGVVDTLRRGREFTPDELRLVETVSSQIAGAIENVRLFEQAQRQRQIAEGLREVAAVLNSSLDQDVILNIIFEHLEQVIYHDSAGLFLAEGDALVLRAGRNLSGPFIGNQLSAASNNPAVQVFHKKEAVVVGNVDHHAEWETWSGGEKIQAWIGAPLLIQDQAIGVLTLDNFSEDAYRREDVQLLQAFANQAAIAIQNAQLYSEAQHEISERKETEKALAQARDAALAASRLKSQLLAKVSHELRTPLGAILGYSELLQGGMFGPLSDEQVGATVEIIDSTGYLTDLVNELLDQAQIDAGAISLNYKPFDIKKLINRVGAKMSVLAHAKELEFVIDVAAELPATLIGDRYRLHQIMVNLTSNAIKFTARGAVKIRVYLSQSNQWTFQVKDTGPGIPAEAQRYIFEPFRQVDGSLTREQVGTGLGLSIVKQLVQLMEGEIRVKSELGQGSEFTVSLPLHLPEEQTI